MGDSRWPGAQGGEEVRRGAGVEHVVFCEPGAAQLPDAVAHFLHVAGVVRVGVDGDFAAQLFCQAQVAVAEVEPVGVGVVLHSDADSRAAEDCGRLI